MQAFWKFNALRIGLFVAVLLVLGLLRFRGPLLLLLAAIISLALSYVLLRGPREELAAVIAERIEARNAAGHPTLDRRLEDDAAAEDADVEASEGDVLDPHDPDPHDADPDDPDPDKPDPVR